MGMPRNGCRGAPESLVIYPSTCPSGYPKSFEVMSPWDLGGDGKAFFGFHPDEEWYVKLMRK